MYSTSLSLPVAVAWVAAGGAIGSVLRYLIAVAAAPISSRFPSGTLIANVTGCLCAGVMLYLVLNRPGFPPSLRLLITTGFLGGLTTFSTFSAETLHLLERGQIGAAALNVGLNVLLGLGAAWVGYTVMRAAA
jgi:CrcB protein